MTRAEYRAKTRGCPYRVGDYVCFHQHVGRIVSVKDDLLSVQIHPLPWPVTWRIYWARPATPEEVTQAQLAQAGGL